MDQEVDGPPGAFDFGKGLIHGRLIGYIAGKELINAQIGRDGLNAF